MEQRYNIHFNRKEPDRDQLKGFQNFDQLLQSFESGTPPSLPKTRLIGMRSRYRYLTYVVGTAAAVLLLLFARGQWGRDTAIPAFPDTATYFASRPFILPPATANMPDVSAVTISHTAQSQTINLDNGTLVLSQSALFRDRGRAIEQPFQLHYRQLDEVVDYFLAGIPLTSLESGQLQQLDAAVMLEVAATEAGKLLPIAANEEVAVRLTTQVHAVASTPDYALYRLDTVQRKWEKIGAVTARFEPNQWPEDWESVQQYQRVVADYARQMSQLKASTTPLPMKPQPPKRVVEHNPTIELDFLNGLALAAGSDVRPEDLERLNSRGIWELLPETGQIDLRAFNVIWEQVRLRRLDGSDRYELTLINPQRQEILLIQPILLNEANYQAALARYELAMKRYETALAASEKNGAQDSLGLVAERDQALAAAKQAIEAQLAQLPAAERRKYQVQKVHFSFAIASWGLYAVARTVEDLPANTLVDYLDEDKSSAKDRLLYVADSRYKTLYRSLQLPENQALPLCESCKIWSVDAQGQVAIASTSDEAGSTKIRFRKIGPLASSAALVKQQLSLD